MIMTYDYINNCVCCGSEPVVEHKLIVNHTDDYSRIVNTVYCPNCGRSVTRRTKEIAISEWNKINKRNEKR